MTSAGPISIRDRLEHVTMMGASKDNTEGLAFLRKLAEEAKALYGHDIKIIEMTPMEPGAIDMAEWVLRKAPSEGEDDSDGTYSPPTAAASVFYGESTASATSEADALIEELKTWADMTPAERIRAQYLEDRGMTEASLEALPEDEREAIEAAIRDLLERQLGTTEQTSPESEIMDLLKAGNLG